MTTSDYGQIAYRAYYAALDIEEYPPWEDLNAAHQLAWRLVAGSVISAAHLNLQDHLQC